MFVSCVMESLGILQTRTFRRNLFETTKYQLLCIVQFSPANIFFRGTHLKQITKDTTSTQMEITLDILRTVDHYPGKECTTTTEMHFPLFLGFLRYLPIFNLHSFLHSLSLPSSSRTYQPFQLFAAFFSLTAVRVHLRRNHIIFPFLPFLPLSPRLVSLIIYLPPLLPEAFFFYFLSLSLCGSDHQLRCCCRHHHCW